MYSSFVYMKGRSGKNFLFDCHFVEIYMQRERKKSIYMVPFSPIKVEQEVLGVEAAVELVMWVDMEVTTLSHQVYQLWREPQPLTQLR